MWSPSLHVWTCAGRLFVVKILFWVDSEFVFVEVTKFSFLTATTIHTAAALFAVLRLLLAAKAPRDHQAFFLRFVKWPI